MTDKELKKELIASRYYTFALAVFCFVIIPAMILSFSVYKICESEEEELVFNLKNNMQRLAGELTNNLSAEDFFCRLLLYYNERERHSEESTPQEPIKMCLKLREFFGEDFNFAVFSRKDGLVYESIPFGHSSATWSGAFEYILNSTRYYFGIESLNSGSLEAAREILGPLTLSGSFHGLFNEYDYSLCWLDASGKISPSGIYCFKWGGLFVFISGRLLKDIKHLEYLINSYVKEKGVTAGLYDSEKKSMIKWSSPDNYSIEEIKKAFENRLVLENNIIETYNYHICQQYLTTGIRSFVVAKKANTILQMSVKCLLAFLLYIVCSFPIIKYGWNTIVLKIPGNASIRLKLAFLFFFASCLPLLVLGIIAKEYSLNKRISLIEEARAWSVENLLGIEQRYFSFLKDLSNNYDAFLDDWAKELKNKNLTKDYSRILLEKIEKDDVIDYYCVASEAKYLSSFEGLIRYTGDLDSVKIDAKKCDLIKNIRDYRYEELRMANIIMKKVCSDINGTEIPSAVLSKLEIVAETVLQKSFSELLSSVIETKGSIREWGIDRKSNMTYFKFISVNEPPKIDYITLLSWKPETLQFEFVKKVLSKANRNPKNFKFLAYTRNRRSFFPEIYNGQNDLIEFVNRASLTPTEELEIIKYNNEDYIAVSFVGRQLNRFSFVGLYPISNIDRIIYEQSSLLWILGLLCLMLASGLAQLLTKSFVKPLYVLKEAALAIEKRDSKHRLADLAKDEFGEVGGVFNKVMVGLEELEIAKIIQESMFPKPCFSQGSFSIYGKTITMIDVGGDYLDFFKVDDNSFSLLIGDVAGHGVGAAVIMAMAKATVLAGDCLKSPSAILQQLHKVILAAKNSKQKKIMTFQYIYVNSESAEAVYGNAGGCSPCLVKHNSGIVENLKLPGAALGAFKKYVYSEISFKLEEEDALVVYTDGIIESKDKKGNVIGYDGFKQILLRSWDANAEQYYNNIMKEYFALVGEDVEATDDLTVAVMIYKHSECATE